MLEPYDIVEVDKASKSTSDDSRIVTERDEPNSAVTQGLETGFY